MRALPALAAALLVPSISYAAPPLVKPLALGEFDFRLHAAERIEGEDGFGVARLRLGASTDIKPWFNMTAQAEWAREKPVLLDAFVAIRPLPSWEIRVGASKTPLFSSARDEQVYALPIPERSI